MLHQAAEHFYACLLLVLTNYRPKTHNIKTLHHMAINATIPDTLLNTVFNSQNRFEKRCFELLKQAYVNARYSEHYRITQKELAWLFEEVTKLRAVVEQACHAHIDALKRANN